LISYACSTQYSAGFATRTFGLFIGRGKIHERKCSYILTHAFANTTMYNVTGDAYFNITGNDSVSSLFYAVRFRLPYHQVNSSNKCVYLSQIQMIRIFKNLGTIVETRRSTVDSKWQENKLILTAYMYL